MLKYRQEGSWSLTARGRGVPQLRESSHLALWLIMGGNTWNIDKKALGRKDGISIKFRCPISQGSSGCK